MKKKKQVMKKISKRKFLKNMSEKKKKKVMKNLFFKTLVCNEDRIHPVQILPQLWLNINYETLSLSEANKNNLSLMKKRITLVMLKSSNHAG